MKEKLYVDYYKLQKKDLEYARKLRNKNKEYCFTLHTVSKEEQLKWFKGLEKQHIEVFLIYVNGNVAGTFSLWYNDEHEYEGLNHIILEDKFRNKGIFQLLMKRIRKEFTPKRFEIYTLITNLRAIRAYEKAGFRIFCYGLRI